MTSRRLAGLGGLALAAADRYNVLTYANLFRSSSFGQLQGTHGNNKWEVHDGAVRAGEFCAFDSAYGRAVQSLYTDFCNEVV